MDGRHNELKIRRYSDTSLQRWSVGCAAVALITATIFTGCSQDAERSTVADVMTADALHSIEYVESSDVIEPDMPEGNEIVLDPRAFVESLMPFIEYREFGTGFASQEEEQSAFKTWLETYIVVVDDHPSGYLLSLMWTLLAPPAEFQRAVLERELVDNGLIEWEPAHFRDRYPRYLYELAQVWLHHNSETRPSWLNVRS